MLTEPNGLVTLKKTTFVERLPPYFWQLKVILCPSDRSESESFGSNTGEPIIRSAGGRGATAPGRTTPKTPPPAFRKAVEAGTRSILISAGTFAVGGLVLPDSVSLRGGVTADSVRRRAEIRDPQRQQRRVFGAHTVTGSIKHGTLPRLRRENSFPVRRAETAGKVP